MLSGCSSLVDIVIPDTVTAIGRWAFAGCTNLTNVTIGRRLGIMRDQMFADCPNLAGVHFEGDCPGLAWKLILEENYYLARPFYGSTNVTVYYLPGTTGWDSTYDGRPTAPWVRPNPVILNTVSNFGIQTNGFGFRISWATNLSVVVEAAIDLGNPIWSPVATNT